MDRADKPLKVLHVTFNMGFGGTEQVIRQLISEMDETEASNCVLCIDGSIGVLGRSLQAAGVEVRALHRNSGFDWRLIGQIRELIGSGQFDIVHCHQYTPFIYGRLAAMGTRARVVFTEHGRFHPDRYRYKAALINWLLAQRTPAIVAISSATREALSRYEFMPARKIQVIYNGIKGLSRNQHQADELRASLGIPETSFVVGTVSRLDPVKNQAMMIRAFGQLLDKHPDSYLLMVGDGPEREALKHQVQQAGLTERVVFTGYVDQPANYLAALDLFLLSSYTEGTSMTLLEAMSLGVPIVATRVGGNPEIVLDGETGLLVDSDDDRGFADAMIRLVQDNEMREGFARSGCARFRTQFTAPQMTAEYLKVYSGVLRAGAHNG